MKGDELTQVWSCGGGTQSIAIAALIIQGKLPKPDLSVIVDTEREKSSTWEYYDSVLKPELANVGIELHRVAKSQFATVDLYSVNDEHMLLPAYTTINRKLNGDPGKLSPFCSGEWKFRTVERWLRTQGIKKSRRWIGFSYDESKRINKMVRGQDFKDGLVWFPLVLGVAMRRDDCVKIVTDMGWPDPPRSACWMCPNQGDAEWRELKEKYPDDFQQACDLEDMVRERDPHAFLHSSCVPLRDVDFAERPGLFTERECSSGMCFI